MFPRSNISSKLRPCHAWHDGFLHLRCPSCVLPQACKTVAMKGCRKARGHKWLDHFKTNDYIQKTFYNPTHRVPLKRNQKKNSLQCYVCPSLVDGIMTHGISQPPAVCHSLHRGISIGPADKSTYIRSSHLWRYWWQLWKGALDPSLAHAKLSYIEVVSTIIDWCTLCTSYLDVFGKSSTPPQCTDSSCPAWPT